MTPISPVNLKVLNNNKSIRWGCRYAIRGFVHYLHTFKNVVASRIKLNLAAYLYNVPPNQSWFTWLSSHHPAP